MIEETHSDMCSSLKGVSRASFCEILTVERDSECFKLPKDLFYLLTLKTNSDDVEDAVEDVGRYEPTLGDVIAFTDIRPKCIDDLNRPKRYYHIAYVTRPKDANINEIPILSSKFLETMDEYNLRSNQVRKLYAVYLLNILTNIRIWKALNSQLEDAGMNIIERVQRPDLNVRKLIYLL